jgi:hypothetical protein
MIYSDQLVVTQEVSLSRMVRDRLDGLDRDHFAVYFFLFVDYTVLFGASIRCIQYIVCVCTAHYTCAQHTLVCTEEGVTSRMVRDRLDGIDRDAPSLRSARGARAAARGQLPWVS